MFCPSFSQSTSPPRSLADLRFIRPSDENLKGFVAEAEEFFDGLGDAFRTFGRYLAAQSDTAAKSIVTKNRRTDGGHVLFRPAGLRLFAELRGVLVQGRMTARDVWPVLKKLPTDLTATPYRDVLWLPNGRMNPSGRPLCRRLLLHMLGLENNPDDLARKYARLLDIPVDEVNLPERV